jgi:predicted sulfurtransferase
MKIQQTIPPILMVALALLMACAVIGRASVDVRLMTADELNAMLDDPDLVILDVRRGKDWTSSEFKIKGATYVKPEAYDEWVDTYPKSQKIVLYCA